MVGDLVGALAGRDIDAGRAERDVHQAALRRLVGEVERDARAVGFGPAGGVIVDLQDQVAVAVEELRDIVRIARGECAGSPAAEAARGQETGRAEAGIAAAGIALAGSVGGVLEEDDVVHHLGIARAGYRGRAPSGRAGWARE